MFREIAVFICMCLFFFGPSIYLDWNKGAEKERNYATYNEEEEDEGGSVLELCIIIVILRAILNN